MFSLFIHQDAEADIERLWEQEPEVAGRISALFEELEGNQDLLDRLSQHGYGAEKSAEFDVSKWHRVWRKGKDLWRLKIWDLEKAGVQYRVIYAFMPQKHHYHVLGIVPRSFDYAEDHPISQRILSAYEEL